MPIAHTPERWRVYDQGNGSHAGLMFIQPFILHDLSWPFKNLPGIPLTPRFHSIIRTKNVTTLQKKKKNC